MKSAMDTQQIFYNLTTKFLKPHLAKANSESHLEGLLSGITFTKTLKKKKKSIPLFKSKLKLGLLSFSDEITYF